MCGPDGVVYPMKGVFQELIKPSRLVFTTSAFEDQRGEWGLETHNTVTLVAVGRKTRLTVVARVMKQTSQTQAAIQGMDQGWSQSLDRLEICVDDSRG
jgi:uncharacterized protein YndB with AHSA1/START domain